MSTCYHFHQAPATLNFPILNHFPPSGLRKILAGKPLDHSDIQPFEEFAEFKRDASSETRLDAIVPLIELHIPVAAHAAFARTTSPFLFREIFGV